MAWAWQFYPHCFCTSFRGRTYICAPSTVSRHSGAETRIDMDTQQMLGSHHAYQIWTRSRGTHFHTVLAWEKRQLTSHVPPFSHGDSAQSSISINHRSTMHHNTSMDWTGLNMAREDLSGIHTGGGRETWDFPKIPLPPPFKSA